MQFGGASGSGVIGESAYQLWLDDGNTGTVEDFLAALVGAAGSAGSGGATGATGAQGPSGNIELGYAENTTGLNVTATGRNDLSGLAITLTAGTRPIELSAWANVQFGKGTATVGSIISGSIYIVDTSNSSDVAVASWQAAIQSAAIIQPMLLRKRVSLTQGASKTYKLQMAITTLPAGAAMAVLGSATYPAHITAREL